MYKKVAMTGIDGIRVGQSEDRDAQTGCTVVLCEDGAVAGMDLRGSAPGTRETELLRPGFLIRSVHGILLTGGSAFGLDAAGGVQRYLAERDKGYDARGIRVPIVPAAVIFDLHTGRSDIRPTADMAYAACQNASAREIVCGLAGAGTGATVGKITGKEHAMPGGVGYAAETLKGNLTVAAVAVVNALGDVVDPDTNRIIAGARLPGGDFLDSARHLRQTPPQSDLAENTTLAIVMTNADLGKSQINKVAQMAQNGLVRTIRPAHTLFDGDVVFALSRGEIQADINLVGDMAAAVLSRAIAQAVRVSNGL